MDDRIIRDKEECKMAAALELQDLSVQFHTGKEIVQAVRGVSLEVQEGEVLAIVGESGCGKSVLCKSVMKRSHRRLILQADVPCRWRGYYRLPGAGDGEASGKCILDGVSGSDDFT